MITPKLEQLIWEGRAFFKTFVAGGSQRHNLNIQQDRFIIITDITYFSSGHFPESTSGNFNTFEELQTQGMNTQITILGERGVNRFLFRNSFVQVPGPTTAPARTTHILPVGHTAINTYLLHTTQVAFSFSLAKDLIAQTVAVTPGEFFAIQPPTDYGRDGQPGALNVTTVAQVNSVPAYDDLFAAAATANADESKEFSFPVNATTNIVDTNRVNSWAYPILHVNYVEVIGNPNNMSI